MTKNKFHRMGLIGVTAVLSFIIILIGELGRDGSRWHFAAVDPVGDVGQHASITVGNLDRVCIAYYETTNQDLKNAHFDDNN